MARRTKAEIALEKRVDRCAQKAVDRIQIPMMKIPAIFSRAAILAATISNDDELIAEIRAYAQSVAA